MKTAYRNIITLNGRTTEFYCDCKVEIKGHWLKQFHSLMFWLLKYWDKREGTLAQVVESIMRSYKLRKPGNTYNVEVMILDDGQQRATIAINRIHAVTTNIDRGGEF